MISYKNSLRKRKEYLEQICKQHKTWTFRMIVYGLLNILTLIIIIGVLILLITQSTDLFEVFMFLIAMIGMACVPFFISCSVKNTAKYKCGFPYSSFANSNLILHEDRLEFIHWRTGIQEPASYSSKRAVYREEDQFIYTILKDEISSLKIDDLHICHIKGNGIVSQPEWAGTKGVREEIATKTFSFLLDFEDISVEETIRKWYTI